MVNKRAQEYSPTAGVSILIILIGLFIMAYMLLIPEDLRDQLLGKDSVGDIDRCLDDCSEDYDDCRTGCDSSGCNEKCRRDLNNCRDRCGIDIVGVGKNLLSESPGLVVPFTDEIVVIDLADVALFSREETEPISLARSLSISRSLFSDRSKSLSFSLDDLDNIGELGLIFLAKKSEGNLLVSLNDNLVYEGDVNVNDLPISLPKIYLKKNNEIKLSVSSPGFRFFSVNNYDLVDVKLIKSLNIENKEARRTFTILKDEISRVKDAALDYYVYCEELYANGRLEIKLNGRLVYPTDVIVCDVNQPPLGLDLSYLREGKNILEFKIDKGDYRIEQLQVALDISDKFFPKYPFEVDSMDFEDIVYGDVNVILDIKFGDSSIRKRAAVTINDNAISFDTKSDRYTKDITDFVYEGANHIKVIPDSEFVISSLQIYLE